MDTSGEIKFRSSGFAAAFGAAPVLLVAATAVVLLLGSCKGDLRHAAPTLTELKKELLGVAMDSLPALADWVSRDTVLEGDEGVIWKARAWYSGRGLVLLAEANWEDATRVHRITILGPQVREGRLYVGQRMKDIGALMAGTLPSGPDGYLFLTLKLDTSMSVQLDVSGLSPNSPLLEGGGTITDVPDSLPVESIVIMGEVPQHVGGVRPAKKKSRP